MNEPTSRAEVWQTHNEGQTMFAAQTAIDNLKFLLADEKLACDDKFIDHVRQVVVLCTAAAKKCRNLRGFEYFILNAICSINDYYPVTTKERKFDETLWQAWDQAYGDENGFIAAARDILKLASFLSHLLENRRLEQFSERLIFFILDEIALGSIAITAMVLNFIVENDRYEDAKKYFKKYIEEHDEEPNETLIITTCILHWRAYEENDDEFKEYLATYWSTVCCEVNLDFSVQQLEIAILQRNKAANVDFETCLDVGNINETLLPVFIHGILAFNTIYTSPDKFCYI